MSLEYWNHYRPHAGLDGRMVLPYQQNTDGEIQEISFLGGLLHGYRRVKAVIFYDNSVLEKSARRSIFSIASDKIFSGSLP